MRRIQFDEAFSTILAEKFAAYRKLFEWGMQAHLKMHGLPPAPVTQTLFNPADPTGFDVVEVTPVQPTAPTTATAAPLDVNKSQRVTPGLGPLILPD